MNEYRFPMVSRILASFDTTSAADMPSGQCIKEERLPFTIRQVQSENELHKAVRIRHAAYARHVPELGEQLRVPEEMDYDSDVAVLLAESKLDGSPLGTARIQTNLFRSLSVEQSVQLPAPLKGQRLAEVTRLGVENGRIGQIVKIALVKACFQYCEFNKIDWTIAAGRAPLDKQYEHLMFEDLFPERGFIPMRHAGGLPHRVMAFEIGTGHARWAAANHPLLPFFSYTRHPDISVDVGHLPLQRQTSRLPQATAQIYQLDRFGIAAPNNNGAANLYPYSSMDSLSLADLAELDTNKNHVIQQSLQSNLPSS